MTLKADFASIASPWLALGYVVIPSKDARVGTKEETKGNKHPIVTFKQYCGEGRWFPDEVVLGAWVDEFPDSNGLLLPDSSSTDLPDMLIIDVDDLAHLPWVIDTFGDSNLRVTTGRENGGVQLYYAIPPGVSVSQANGRIGPPEAWVKMGKEWKTHIDVKSSRNYVVAPGSLHRTGAVYTANAPITRETILALPVIDVALLQSLIGANCPVGHDIDIDGAGSGTRRGFGRGKSDYARIWVDFSDPEYSKILIHYQGLSAGEQSRYVKCPLHDHENNSNCGIAWVDENGRLRWTCFARSIILGDTRGGVSYRVSSTSTRTEPQVEGTAGNSVILTTSVYEKHIKANSGLPMFDPFNPVGLRKFTDLSVNVSPRVVCLKVSKGGRKTTLASWLREERQRRDPSFVCLGVAHLIGLTASLATRLGLPFYQGLEGAITGSAAICAPSLPRWKDYSVNAYQGNPYGDIELARLDLLVIDEVEQVLRSLIGAHLSDSERRAIYDRLRSLVGQAKQVLLMDADISPLTAEFLHSCGVDASEILCIKATIPDPFEYVWCDDGDALWAWTIQEALAGKRLFIATFDSPERAQARARQLLKADPKLRVGVICSKTSESFNLSDINALVVNFDVLICTPSIATGVSIEVPHFDRIIGFFGNRVGTAQDAHQMLRRVRSPRCQEIVYYAPKKGWETETNIDVLKLALLNKEEVTRKKVDRPRAYIPDVLRVRCGKIDIDKDAAAYLDIHCRILSHNARSGQTTIGESLWTYLEHLPREPWDPKPRNWTPGVDEEEAEKAQETLTELKETIKEEARQETLTADDLPIEVVKKARKAKDRKQAAAFHKAYLKDFYGEVTEAIIKFDDDGEGRTKARAFARVQMLIEGRQDTLVRADQKQLDEGTSTAGLRHYLTTAQGMRQILTWFGLGDLDPQATITSNDPKLKTIAKTAIRLRHRLKLHGITVREDVEENPISLLSGVLRQLGLRLTEVGRQYVTTIQVTDAKGQPKDKKVFRRLYTLDHESLDEMKRMSTRFALKLRMGLGDEDSTEAIEEALFLEELALEVAA